ncbi:transposase [Geminicoccus flavidas]|uniref:transposase n=1 Tax=Geminicoccus flavidas TaxID=2506407 RepID=UPI0038B2D518
MPVTASRCSAEPRRLSRNSWLHGAAVVRSWSRTGGDGAQGGGLGKPVEALLPAVYGSNQRLEWIGAQVDGARIEALLLQQWYRLSDRDLEGALADRLSLRRSCGFILEDAATSLPRFRIDLAEARGPAPARPSTAISSTDRIERLLTLDGTDGRTSPSHRCVARPLKLFGTMKRRYLDRRVRCRRLDRNCCGALP